MARQAGMEIQRIDNWRRLVNNDVPRRRVRIAAHLRKNGFAVANKAVRTAKLAVYRAASTAHAAVRTAAIISVIWLATSTPAVILYGTGDATANTTAPTGALTNSGWQYEGEFGDFLGTAIAANYFITAKHIGGSVGQSFVLNNVVYTTTAVFPDPSSDLQVWKVSGTFPAYASLYSGTPGSEVNLNLVVFGRGTQRGDAVYVGSDSHLGGWLWGTSDYTERWGTNVVGSIQTDPTYGQLLRVPFDSSGGQNEAHL